MAAREPSRIEESKALIRQWLAEDAWTE